MRMMWWNRARTLDDTQCLTKAKINSKRVVERVPSRTKGKLHVRKCGRIVELVFPMSRLDSPGYGSVQLAESEVFFLAALCQRDRSDEELLQAIKNAREDKPEGRKSK